MLPQLWENHHDFFLTLVQPKIMKKDYAAILVKRLPQDCFSILCLPLISFPLPFPSIPPPVIRDQISYLEEK